MSKKKNHHRSNPQKNTNSAASSLPPAIRADDKTIQARLEADSDIAADPELSAHHPNDDLDEGETARLGEDRTDLV